MRITFDPNKRDAALAERGLDFADAVEVFDSGTVDLPDTRFAYPEPRTVTYGYLTSGWSWWCGRRRRTDAG